MGVLGGLFFEKISGFRLGPKETFLGVLPRSVKRSSDDLRFSLVGVRQPAFSSSSCRPSVVSPATLDFEGLLLEVVDCLGDFKNAGRGMGFGETSKLDSFAALLGVKRPRDDSSAAVLLDRFLFGVVEILPAVGEGASARAEMSLSNDA